MESMKKRCLCYSNRGEKLLCLAWLGTNVDMFNGAEKKDETFWRRFHENLPYSPYDQEKIGDRDESSLSHRWYTIQEVVNKFSGAYAQTHSGQVAWELTSSYVLHFCWSRDCFALRCNLLIMWLYCFPSLASRRRFTTRTWASHSRCSIV